ncbi:MAG: DEAD/DEAH box helicase [Nitriliruptoraceae bacterium]
MPTPDHPFTDLGLRADLVTTLTDLGYEEPTPIQQAAIPVLLAGSDLLGQAATGTGKTAAFALPILQRLPDGERGRSPRALVLAPTRELAMQVSQAIHAYGRRLAARVLPVYGGQPIWRQLKELSRGVDVVVATPGRAVDLLGRGALHLDDIEVVVLDEADEMLDMGFAEDLEAILAATPTTRQTVLFSATLPARIDALARQHLTDPQRITIGHRQAGEAHTPKVRQLAYVVPRGAKPAALGRLLDTEAPEAAIVFCGTRVEVDHLTEVMNGRGYRAEALHGGMDQEQRDRVMDRLRAGTADLLVATDVAARGLDIDHLTHVINHDVPAAPETYTHRIGRVGRAGRTGVAITLVEPRQRRLVRAIEQHTGSPLTFDQLPTVADLRARRLELTREAIEARLLSDTDLDRFQGVLSSLADTADPVEVALAAISLVHERLAGSDDDQELPRIELHDDRPRTKGRHGGHAPTRGGRAETGGRPGGGRGRATSDTVRIYIGAGQRQGIRPKDLVGAIANESGLRGSDVGNIEITPNFSLVEVPRTAADEVIRSLRASTIKGRRTTVRPDRHG